MAVNETYTPLPADLPEDWGLDQIVAPAGADVGLSEQHGYNYLMEQVNAAQRAANQLQETKQPLIEGQPGEFMGFGPDGKPAALPSSRGIPAGGVPGQVIGKTGAGDYEAGWRDAVGKAMAGQTVSPVSGTEVVAGEGAEAFNDYRARTWIPVSGGGYSANTGNIASGKYAHAEGMCTTASGSCSHAEGGYTIASGDYAHAEGNSTASGMWSHAENSARATGQMSHGGGSGCKANGFASFAHGESTVADGSQSIAIGNTTKAAQNMSAAFGYGTIANFLQFVIGNYNVDTDPENKITNEGSKFIIGNGTYEQARKNVFRVHSSGTTFATGSYNSTGADYAELFEWLDGNPDGEDRVGRFVTLEGEKIRLAQSGDDFILGVISAAPSVVGDVYDDQWTGKYMVDIYGRPVFEEVQIPEKTDTDGTVIPAHTERWQKINPDYDDAQNYIPRTQRPEWVAVGMMGKLVAADDGTCQVNGWAAVGEDGRATHSDVRTKYRVMSRRDETHIKILIL